MGKFMGVGLLVLALQGCGNSVATQTNTVEQFSRYVNSGNTQQQNVEKAANPPIVNVAF